MILSFHPIIEADQNIICAGRAPNKDDLAAIQDAEAVILPQGCSETLYRMARSNCPHIFPNQDLRFDYPGKRGQIELFRKLDLAHPVTQGYGSLSDFHQSGAKIDLPAIVKLDWGGQGDTVFKVESEQKLAQVLDHVRTFETSGQFGFLIQQFIPTGQRSLRVALIHTQTRAYWRIQSPERGFGTSVAHGARIDHVVDAKMSHAALKMVHKVNQYTGLQLAGFDFIFAQGSQDQKQPTPLVLEINYFFGRRGLGGSQAYYRLLEVEIDKWLATLSLSR